MIEKKEIHVSKKSTWLTDRNIIIKKIRGMEIHSLEAHNQEKGDCGLFTVYNRQQYIQRFSDWLCDKSIMYTPFIKVWKKDDSYCQDQINAIRNKCQAMLIKLSEYYLYTLQFDDQNNSLLKNPYVNQNREKNNKTLEYATNKYVTLNESYFIANNDCSKTHLDSERVNKLLPTILDDWSSYGINFGILNGEFILLKRFDHEGLEDYTFISEDAKVWSELPWIYEKWKKVHWYGIFAAIEIGDRVWLSRCLMTNPETNETLYLGRGAITMCDNPKMRGLCLSAEKNQFIELHDDQLKKYNCKPSVIFDVEMYDFHFVTILKGKDWLYQFRENGKARCSKKQYIHDKDLALADKISEMIDVSDVRVEGKRDPEQLKAYHAYINSKSGSIISSQINVAKNSDLTISKKKNTKTNNDILTRKQSARIIEKIQRDGEESVKMIEDLARQEKEDLDRKEKEELDRQQQEQLSKKRGKPLGDKIHNSNKKKPKSKIGDEG